MVENSTIYGPEDRNSEETVIAARAKVDYFGPFWPRFSFFVFDQILDSTFWSIDFFTFKPIFFGFFTFGLLKFGLLKFGLLKFGLSL